RLVVSMTCRCLREQVTAVGGTLWQQLYWLRDRGQVTDMIQRAEAAGCRALVLTVDVPRLGRRLRDMRNAFALPPGVTAANLHDEAAGLVHRPAAGAPGGARHTNYVSDPPRGWGDGARLSRGGPR